MHSVLIVNNEQDILEVTRLFPERFVGENTAIEALNNGAGFFLKKSAGTCRHSSKKKVHMINQAVEQRSMGRAIGTPCGSSPFFSEPASVRMEPGKNEFSSQYSPASTLNGRRTLFDVVKPRNRNGILIPSSENDQQVFPLRRVIFSSGQKIP